MKNKIKNSILFLNQDICRWSTFILLFLSLVSGFSIIYSRNYLSGSFRVDNIYAMYSTISNFLLIFMAVNLFGKEFQYKTINMIKISNKSGEEIILRKLFVMLFLSSITALLVFFEIFIFEYLIYNNSEIELFKIGINLVKSYLLYGAFLFIIGSILVMIIKNTLYSFVSLLLLLRIGVTVMNILGNFKLTSRLIPFVPLSFVENSFYFANYTLKESMVLILWSGIFLFILVFMYKKRGYK